MRTRKMRLVSALLAVAMMFVMLPVSAFADTVVTIPTDHIKHLTFDGDQPDIESIHTKKDTQKDSNGNDYDIYTPTDTEADAGWQWSGLNGFKLIILPDYTYSVSDAPAEVPCIVNLYSGAAIESGHFLKNVISTGGTIVGGSFESVEGRVGTVTGGYIRNYSSKRPSWSTTFNNHFDGGIVYGSFTFETGTGEFVSGIVSDLPEKGFDGQSQVISIPGATIYPVINGETVTEAPFKDTVYVLGTSANIKTRTFKAVVDSAAFAGEWGTLPEGATLNSDGSLNITLPDTGNVEIEINPTFEKTPLNIVGGVPVGLDGEPYNGSIYDGWVFTPGKGNVNSTLTVYGSVDLGSNAIDWTVVNHGIIEGGIFNCEDVEEDVLTNDEDGKIIGGTYNVKVKNLGIIDGGTFYQAVSNYGTVENGTFAERYSNTKTKEYLPDGTTNTKDYGETKGGVFSRYAYFDTQENVQTRWLTVNGGKINGAISGQAFVVGHQYLTVSADDTSAWTGWSVTTDDPDFELTDYQKSHPEFELELDGNDAAKGSIVINALVKDGYYRLNMLDGKATVDGVKATSATVGKTVTLSIDDSEIPEGMSFDHWVISPEVEPDEGYKITDRTMNFTMPAQELTIYASLRTDSDDGMDAMTVVAGVAIGAGAAVLTYHIGTELYAKQVLGDGVAIPRTREDVALKAWELAGKPAVTMDGEPLSEAAQAEKWAIERGLMQNVDGSFNGSKKMSKLKALRVLDSAKKMNAQ